MIKKGIVEEIIDQYSVRVRIPQFHGIKGSAGATKTEEILPATICTVPNININFRINDIVIVGFENDDFSKPLILGALYAEGNNRSTLDIRADTLTVDIKTILETDSDVMRLDGKIEEISELDLKDIFEDIKYLKHEFSQIINGDDLQYGGA